MILNAKLIIKRIMAKPRIFVSSTYIDLKHARRHIEGFIKAMGYESVLFESGDITFHHDIPIDKSCYAEIDTCHMLVLIVGGKYGSPTSEAAVKKEDDEKAIKFYNSITKMEYEAARVKNLPIFIFVEKGVFNEYQTFKKNREIKGINYAHVDNVNIFLLLDDIVNQKVNNYVKTFENFEDITSWLKDQWAGMLADFLVRSNNDNNLLTLQNQITELNEISKSLKIYNEQLLKKVSPNESEEIIKSEDQKRQKRLQIKFSKFRLIEHITEKLKQEGIIISNDDVYNFFIQSENFEDFLNLLKLSPDEKGYLFSIQEAQEDYDELRLLILGF